MCPVGPAQILTNAAYDGRRSSQIPSETLAGKVGTAAPCLFHRPNIHGVDIRRLKSIHTVWLPGIIVSGWVFITELLIEMLASLPSLNLSICPGEQIQTLHIPEKKAPARENIQCNIFHWRQSIINIPIYGCYMCHCMMVNINKHAQSR